VIAALTHYYGVEAIGFFLIVLLIACAVQAYVLPFVRRRRHGMPRSR